MGLFFALTLVRGTDDAKNSIGESAGGKKSFMPKKAILRPTGRGWQNASLYVCLLFHFFEKKRAVTGNRVYGIILKF